MASRRIITTKNGRDLYHRHYCRTCDTRVFPYDSLESLTVAPAPGARGVPVLLFSANSRKREQNPEDVSRVAWCWRCNKFTETYRETKYDTMVRYLRRRGVHFRFNGKNLPAEPEPKMVKALDERIEERRGSGTITIR